MIEVHLWSVEADVIRFRGNCFANVAPTSRDLLIHRPGNTEAIARFNAAAWKWYEVVEKTEGDGR